MHFHLPPIDLSQAWQSFKIKTLYGLQEQSETHEKKLFCAHVDASEALEKP